MKQIGSQATNQQRLSRKGGGDTKAKERANSRVLTVCFTKGMTLLAKIRDYKGGDYEQGKHIEKYAASCVFWKNENHKPNHLNSQEKNQ
jgi:hypothetical protein